MLTIENVSIYGWDAAIRGMRNPMNSWSNSDTVCRTPIFPHVIVGPNDLQLMKKLSWAGNDHGKFLRMITVTFDCCGPLYWLKEFDTYKVSTVSNSCSTMHKIHANPFTEDDFSTEHLSEMSYQIMLSTIKVLNLYRNKHQEAKKAPMKDESKRAELVKHYWWQMIQLLPSSYNQRRTVQLNYAVLKNIYHSRRHHKLDEWHTFCDWIETLPYAKELIVGD